MSALDEVRRRADAILAATRLFDELGLQTLASDTRTLASLTLELVTELESERSARMAIQVARDDCLEIIAARAYDEMKSLPRNDLLIPRLRVLR